MMETTPIVFQGKPMLLASIRETAQSPSNRYLALVGLDKDMNITRELSRFGAGYTFGCAYVNGNEINVYALETTNPNTENIYRFTSTDGINWSAPSLVVAREGGERLYNSSVTFGPEGYVMAYESNQPVQFDFKFARSNDLANWQKLKVPTFLGPNGNEYSACPALRYSNGYYYALYLAENTVNGAQKGWATEIARSKDLLTWEFSDKNPVLAPIEGEGINSSDVDLFEVDGKTYLFYATGDQTTWLELKRAVYDGPMSEFLAGYFPPVQTPEPNTASLSVSGVIALLAYAWTNRKWVAGRFVRLDADY
jgi:hypothetical protein